MNLVPDWLPRSNTVNLLAGVFLLSALFAASRRKVQACVTAYRWNSAALADHLANRLSGVVKHGSSVDRPDQFSTERAGVRLGCRSVQASMSPVFSLVRSYFFLFNQ